MYLQKSVATTPKLFIFIPNKLIKKLFYSFWKSDDDYDNDTINGANKTISPAEGEWSRRPPTPCCPRSSCNPGSYGVARCGTLDIKSIFAYINEKVKGKRETNQIFRDKLN